MESHLAARAITTGYAPPVIFIALGAISLIGLMVSGLFFAYTMARRRRLAREAGIGSGSDVELGQGVGGGRFLGPGIAGVNIGGGNRHRRKKQKKQVISKEQVDEKTVIVDVSDLDSDEACAICQSGFNADPDGLDDRELPQSQQNENLELRPESEVRKLPCRHLFHKSCIVPWLTTRKPCCPLCLYSLLDEEQGPNGTTVATEETGNTTDTGNNGNTGGLDIETELDVGTESQTAPSAQVHDHQNQTAETLEQNPTNDSRTLINMNTRTQQSIHSINELNLPTEPARPEPTAAR